MDARTAARAARETGTQCLLSAVMPRAVGVRGAGGSCNASMFSVPQP